ncbi:RING-type domain-containing protein [Encephalitozoon hellem]|uniref:RING-type domain-containing protein n=1 Tax=Encephalitozoon hellem TaxID=27973 RepID=A0ABY8CMA6_ENCHE|nr:RING-type domain-containing protein [Encephalitozoon hellem]
MGVYRIGAYMILQMFDVSVYVPLYAIYGGSHLGEKLILKDVKIEARNNPELFGHFARNNEEEKDYYVDSLEIYKIEDKEVVRGLSSRVPKSTTLGTMAFDFSMLKAILSQENQKSTGHSPEIKIKSIEIKIPLAVQIFLHIPILLVAVIVFYLFLSFGIEEEGGLSDKEIERIPLCPYSSQEFISKGCIICLEDFEDGGCVRNLGCGHVFHRECVDKWLRKNFVCPVCRSRMSAGHDKQRCERRRVHVL